MATRKITERIKELNHFDEYSIDGPIDDALQNITEARDTAIQMGYTDIRIDVSHDAYDESGVTITFYGDRKENNSEHNKRLADLAKARKKKAAKEMDTEAKERLELKRLKEKYGK